MLQQVAARETVLDLPRLAPEKIRGDRAVTQTRQDVCDLFQRADLVPGVLVVD